MEEKEVINSKEGKDAGFSWIYDSSRYFKCGDGKKGDIDLHDPNGITYDVKNDYINFDKAHTADFLLKYRSYDGIVELIRLAFICSNPLLNSVVEGNGTLKSTANCISDSCPRCGSTT